MNTKQIIFDADGVLLDTLPYFIKWFLLNVPNFDVNKFLRDNVSYLLDEFANNYEVFSNIPPMQGAIETVKRLSKDYKIDVISTYGGNMKRFVGRNENIGKFFGDSINYVFTLPRNFDKKELYIKYPKDTVVIDDSLYNCSQAVKTGHKALWYQYYSSLLSPIINKGNNCHHQIKDKNIIPVSSFVEIEKFFSR
jgi:FMN phosphatase YigB (HAD superfamily)